VGDTISAGQPVASIIPMNPTGGESFSSLISALGGPPGGHWIVVSTHHVRVVPALAASVALAALAMPASAAAHRRAAEAISIAWAVTSPPPTSPPFRGTGVGTFTATGVITDSGTLGALSRTSPLRPRPTMSGLIDGLTRSQTATIELSIV
jgi:hypothetical protein